MLHAPGLEADPAFDGTRSGTFVALHPARAEVLIGGTFYAGEIKKSLFTLMNDRLPLEGVLPMHCAANVGDERGCRALLRPLRHRQDDALGRSEAAADRRRRTRLGRRRRVQLRRRLLRQGDQALRARPNRRSTPPPTASARCWRTSSSTRTGRLDLDERREDREHARRLRARTDLERAPRRSRAGHPSHVVFLTADAFGVMPPIAGSVQRAGRLPLPLWVHRQARRHRDRGQPSRCRRSLPALAGRSCRSRRRSMRACSREQLEGPPSGCLACQHRLDAAARRPREARGCRSQATRTLVHAALSGRLSEAGYRTDDVFGFEVPVAVDGVDAGAPRPALDLERSLGPTTRPRRRSPCSSARTSRPSAMSRPRSPPPDRCANGTLEALPGERARAVPRRAATGFRYGRSVEGRTTSLVIGAGCAGMRAAIEAFDAGARRRAPLEDPSDPQPLGRGRGRDQRRARQRLRGQPRSCTPSTPSRAPTTSPTRTRSRSSAPRRPATSTSSRTGARSSRAPRTAASRSGRSAPPGAPRTAYAADITGHVLIQVLYEQVVKRGDPGLRGVLRLEARRGRRPLRRGDRLGPAARRAAGRSRPARRSSRPAAPAGSTRTRRTPTPAPATGWRWRCAPGWR